MLRCLLTRSRGSGRSGWRSSWSSRPTPPRTRSPACWVGCRGSCGGQHVSINQSINHPIQPSPAQDALRHITKRNEGRRRPYLPSSMGARFSEVMFTSMMLGPLYPIESRRCVYTNCVVCVFFWEGVYYININMCVYGVWVGGGLNHASGLATGGSNRRAPPSCLSVCLTHTPRKPMTGACARMHARTHTDTHRHTPTPTPTPHTHTHTHTHTNAHQPTNTHTHTHPHPHPHTGRQARTHLLPLVARLPDHAPDGQIVQVELVPVVVLHLSFRFVSFE